MRRVVALLLSGLALAVSPTLHAFAESAPNARVAMHDPYAAFVAEASKRFGIPEHWIRAVRQRESGGEVRAVSSAGAMGLMQLMPATWEEQRSLHGLGNDPFRPRDNILAGTAYLRAMWDRYGTIGGMLAAYNFGPGRYDEYLAGVRKLPQETRDYVDAIAPKIGGGPTPATPKKSAANDAGPHDARAAPLFVSVPAAGVLELSSASAVRDLSAIVPQSDGLFVAHARNGDRP